MASEDEIWKAGFKAGETLQGPSCPYQADSHEAWVWQRGWVEGASKRMGQQYCDGPANGKRQE